MIAVENSKHAERQPHPRHENRPQSMNRTKLPITEITVLNRQRFDLGDLQDLADSIRQYGLIQPVVINQNRRLVAGGRRLAACALLGLTEIDVVYKETLSEDVLHEMELEENFKRKDMSWQEETLGIETIHKLRLKRAALDGESWSQKRTAALLGYKGTCTVNYALIIAEKLRAEQTTGLESKPYWSCDSFSEAWQLRLRQEQDEIRAELAKRQSQAQEGLTLTVSSSGAELLAGLGIDMPSGEEKSLSDERSEILPEGIAAIRNRLIASGFSNISKDEAKLYYDTLPNPTLVFEEWWEKGQRRQTSREELVYTIDLTKMLHKGDSIDFMSRPENEGRFDHIITDPPYGIDMDMLNQQNPHSGMVDLDTILDEHEVEPNKALLIKFFPSAFKCLKPNSFCIVWGDQMLWQFCYDLAIAAGFKVQRWPHTWIKLHTCMNQSRQYNETKCTEIAMVCRKGNAVILKEGIVKNYTMAAHDDYKDVLGHPFVKPFECWKDLIELCSIEGQTVLEPFAGRGSGVLSLLRLNRRVVACEMNEAHFNALMFHVRDHFLRVDKNFKFI